MKYGAVYCHIQFNIIYIMRTKVRMGGIWGFGLDYGRVKLHDL